MPPGSTRWRIETRVLEQACLVVREHAVRTQLEDASSLLGRGAFLKREDQQETGSFKLRGAIAVLSALAQKKERRARGVVSASAGNHGLGLARAGALFGVPVTVFVSTGAPRVKREGIARAGARLELVDAASYDDVEACAREAATRLSLPFVSPFDDPHVAAGNGGTLGLELLDECPSLGTLVAPVGGGGLVAGLAAARAHRGASFALVGVQSEACPAMAQSFTEGRALTRFAGAPTLAEGLEGGVSESTYAIARESLARMDVLPEAAIAEAMRVAKSALSATLEGSAAVALAWALAHRDDPDIARPLVVVLTGSNADGGSHDS